MSDAFDFNSMRSILLNTDEPKALLLDALHNKNENPIAIVSDKVGISRQAAHKHMRQLINQGWVVAEGDNRHRKYSLCTLLLVHLYKRARAE